MKLKIIKTLIKWLKKKLRNKKKMIKSKKHYILQIIIEGLN
jgi:hypothetical protein